MEPQVSLPQTGTEPVPVITDSLGTLDTLPPEVRNMVYALVFADGHPALSRTSKALREDTENALFQHGVYRVNITYAPYCHEYSWKVRRRPPIDVIPKVRNLWVRLKLEEMSDRGITRRHIAKRWGWERDDPASPFDYPDSEWDARSAVLTLESWSLALLLQKLVSRMGKPKDCRIECLKRENAIIPITTFAAIESLGRFKSVTVEFLYGEFRDHDRARVSLKHNSTQHRTYFLLNQEMTRSTGLRVDAAPKLTIVQEVSYEDSDRTKKLWGDEPQHEDYGLGVWTARRGRVWQSKCWPANSLSADDLL